MTKKVTFSDIAKYTNFSKTTISRYFNNPDSLTLESRKKIEDALIALDYKENKVARSLANGKSEMIGIIIPDLFLHYYSQMLNCLIKARAVPGCWPCSCGRLSAGYHTASRCAYPPTAAGWVHPGPALYQNKA